MKRSHAAPLAGGGAPCVRQAEVPKQRVLDRNHVRKKESVRVSRTRGSDGNVIDDRAVSHRDNAVREQERLVDVVRDEDHRRNRAAWLFPEIQENLLHGCRRVT